MFSGLSGDLGGNASCPSNWIADFRRLYDFGEAGRADLAVPAAKFNRAMRIDTKLANPLATCRRHDRRPDDPRHRPAPQPRLPQLDAGEAWSSSRPASRWSPS